MENDCGQCPGQTEKEYHLFAEREIARQEDRISCWRLQLRKIRLKLTLDLVGFLIAVVFVYWMVQNLGPMAIFGIIVPVVFFVHSVMLFSDYKQYADCIRLHNTLLESLLDDYPT